MGKLASKFKICPMNMNLEEKIKNFHFGASYRIKCENRESAYTKNGVTYKETIPG